MNQLKKISILYAVVLLLLSMNSCKTDGKSKSESLSTIESDKDPVIEVVTQGMDFQLKDTLQMGWNTFKYINKSNEPHFILFDKYPEGKDITNMKNEVLPAFDEGMAFIMKGDMDAAMNAFGKLPPWFSEIVFSGGTGLVSPNTTAITTVYLIPGYYIMECYVKMANGTFHSSMGMTKELIVLDSKNDHTAPSASINISISSKEGISLGGDIGMGKQVFAVHYLDQIVHENFVGHDINLVRLDDTANLKELESWINWATPTGLMTPTPNGVTFLGGTNDAPAGTTQYFEAVLTPGTYAFIAEVPNSNEKGMLKVFEVSK
jgi:hypothetical protein